MKSRIRAAATLALAFAITVLADVPFPADGSAYAAGAYGSTPSQTFRSSSIIAPVFHIASLDLAAVDPASHIFLGLTYGGRGGPMVFSARDLSLVYAEQRWPSAFDARVQTLNGTRYLTFWEGPILGGHANGYCAVYDESYTPKWNLTAKGYSGGALADLHDFQLTPDGGALFVVYENIPFDVQSVGGPASGGLLMDNAIQEIDVATGAVRFQWRASDHFAVTDSYGTYSPQYGVAQGMGFNFFHINSVEKVSSSTRLP
jgi:hypothetical protein